MSLEVGDLVTLKVRNPIWPRRHAYASYLLIEEFNYYTGRLMARGRGDGADSVRISSDDPKYPVRLIDADRIEEIVINT